jgi:hypothetical protein
MELIKCDAVFEGYPHPGCAKFGPPDHWECDADAVGTVEGVGPFGTWRFYGCAEHIDGPASDPEARLVLRDVLLPRSTTPVDDRDSVIAVLDAMAHAFGSIDERRCFECYCQAEARHYESAGAIVDGETVWERS